MTISRYIHPSIDLEIPSLGEYAQNCAKANHHSKASDAEMVHIRIEYAKELRRNSLLIQEGLELLENIDSIETDALNEYFASDGESGEIFEQRIFSTFIFEGEEKEAILNSFDDKKAALKAKIKPASEWRGY